MGRLLTTPLPVECALHYVERCPFCSLDRIASRGRSASGMGEYRRTQPRKRKDRHVPLETEQTERRALKRDPLPPPPRRLWNGLTWDDPVLPRDVRLERLLDVALKPLDPLAAGPARTYAPVSKPWLTF